MNILFISNHFSLPIHPGAPRPWKVADYLQQAGHQVTVLTNQRHYLNENITIDSSLNEYCGGVKLIGIPTTKGRRASILKRLKNYFSFTLGSLKTGWKLTDTEMIIVGTPPLLVPITGLILGKRLKAFTVLEIRDLYPHTAEVLGVVKNKFVLWVWEKFEHFFRLKYDHIVPVLPDIKTTLTNIGLPAEKITVITNGYDLENDDIAPLPEHLIQFFDDNKDKFLATYGGGMGFGNKLETIVEAANILSKDKNDILFLFFGEGDKKKNYLQMIEDYGLENCHFFPAQPRMVMNNIFRISDVLVHSYINHEFFKCALPNKIFEYHGASKPIVFAGEGTTADLIKNAGSGSVVTPEDSNGIAREIKKYYENTELAAKTGKRARQIITSEYSRDKIFKQWHQIIELVKENK